MKTLLTVFRKEWTEARRDPRAWLLTLVVPLLFYPGVALIGFGAMGTDGGLKVYCPDERVGNQLAELPGLSVTAADEADLYVLVSERDPGFPESGSLWLEFDGPGGVIAVQRLELAIEAWSASIIRERATRAGMKEWDLDPIRRVAPVSGLSGSASPFGGEIIAYLLVFLMFTGSLATAVDSGAGERERGGLEALLATPVNPLHLAAGKVAFILLTGLASVAASLAGLSIAAVLGGGLPSVAMAKWSSVLPAALLLLACGGFTASCLFACSLGARSAREAHAWISGLFLLVSLGLVWVTFGGSGGAWRAWIPLFGATEAIGATLGGQTGISVWLPPLVATLGAGALATLGCMRLLRREAVLRAW